MSNSIALTRNKVIQAGGIALSNQSANPIAVGNTGFYADSNGILQTVAADGTISSGGGEELNTFTAGENISAGQAVYVKNSDGKIYKAKGDASTTVPAIGIAPAAITSAATGPVQMGGIFTTSGLTVGANYYVSAATAGAITATAPSTVGTYVQHIGTALSATQLLVAPGTRAFAAGVTSVGHIVGSGSAPAIAAGAGAGTSPTIAIAAGTDASGLITLTTGSSPTGSNAVIATVTFNVAYAAAPSAVIVVPANNATEALAVGAKAFVDNAQITTALFKVVSGGTALAGTTAYAWYYMVIA